MSRAGVVLAALLLWAGCTESTAPDVRCDGLLEVTTVTTRFGGDTVVACTFPPPDTAIVTDTLVPPPDTIYCWPRKHRHGCRPGKRGHR